jgi:penicillin-binding protein 1A
MNSLLQEVGRSGTAARAQATLKRPDLYGKTGTTNDAIDAWFAGYQPTLAAVVWMGYDTPRKLGDRETGGGLSLPVWINFMEAALKGVPVFEPTAPEGVVNVGGEWYYEEYARGSGVSSLGLEDKSAPGPDGQPAKQAMPPADEEETAFWTCSGTDAKRSPDLAAGVCLKAQRLAALQAGVTRRQVFEELAVALGVHPLRPSNR